jgi:hypothetical protein
MESREKLMVSKVEAITISRSGAQGRPRKTISKAYLQEAFRPGRNISAAKLAKTLGVHRRTVGNYLKMYGIHRPGYLPISNDELDDIVRAYKERHPNTGIRYLRGFLLQKKLRIQRDRLLQSITRVDGVNKQLRKNTTIQRREYQSARPNALWHLDGHHKLIMWGIVIHGIVDGYDRMVRESNDMTNSLVDHSFRLLR